MTSWTEYYDLDEQDMWEGPACPQCGNGPQYLGQLGNRHHWRCRFCGQDYSTQDQSKEHNDERTS